MSPHYYFPLAPIFMLGLLLMLLVSAVLVNRGWVSYGTHRFGLGYRIVFGVLALSLLGSYINIPVALLPARRVVSDVIVSHWGIQYVVPVAHYTSATVIAVNVGGAVVPVVLSLYLLFRTRVYWEAFLGVALVALVVHMLARPVAGVGIVVPFFTPPLVAALVAYMLSRQHTAAVAYICGTLGTLIGADLLNLGAVASLGAPVASIGGAGTFDGVFTAGLLAALIA